MSGGWKQVASRDWSSFLGTWSRRPSRFLTAYVMNKSNISEPFLLATYTSTIRGIPLLKFMRRFPQNRVQMTMSQSRYKQMVHILDVSCSTLYLTNGFGWILRLGIFIASCNITHDGTGYILCLPTFNSSCYIEWRVDDLCRDSCVFRILISWKKWQGSVGMARWQLFKSRGEKKAKKK